MQRLAAVAAGACGEDEVVTAEDLSYLVSDDQMIVSIKLGIYDGFFNDLAILDNKAGALSSAIAIITGFSFFLAQGQANGQLPFFLAGAVCSAFVALILTISVLTVWWSSTEELADRTLEKSLLSICRVRNWRTIRFRTALALSLLSLVFLGIDFFPSRIFG